jgi:hypothetical protein
MVARKGARDLRRYRHVSYRPVDMRNGEVIETNDPNTPIEAGIIAYARGWGGDSPSLPDRIAPRLGTLVHKPSLRLCADNSCDH